MQIDLSLNSESILTQLGNSELLSKNDIMCSIGISIEIEQLKLSLNELWKQNIITESAVIRGRNKLQKRIEKHLKKMNR